MAVPRHFSAHLRALSPIALVAMFIGLPNLRRDRRNRRSSLKRVTLLLVAISFFAGEAASAQGAADKDTRLQLLAINDLHGHLQPSTPGVITIGPGVTVPAGGAEYLSTWINTLRERNPNTLLVAAGDLVGASPLVSGLFHDEPTIEVLNAMHLDMAGVGNHEFDEGLSEIYRLLLGGCHPVDGCQDGDSYLGSQFPYLAANVFFAGTKVPILPPFEIRKVGNAKVAFIGLTLEGTPLLVSPAAIEGLQFRDEVASTNALIEQLRPSGVRTFIVLLHQGGFQNAPFSGGFLDPNGCDNLSGEIVDIANGLSSEVDVVVSGHTHAAYNCNLGGKLVTSASSFGRVVTSIDLVIDRNTKDVKAASAHNYVVRQNVDKDPAITAILNKYVTLSAPLANRVVGSITEDLKSTRDGVANRGGESPLGDVIADAQLEATTPTDLGGAIVAFMNPGGIRAPLLFNQISGGETPGEITYGETFTVQPFGNTLVVKTLTGAQIQRLLEQQFDNPTTGQTRILQISWTLSYSWDSTRPAGDKVLDSSVKIGGVPIDPLGSYRVTMNSFLADGGDGFSVFREGINPLGGEVDVDALVRYLTAHSPVSPPPYLTAPRITRID
jgi:5'-nucleotidase